MKYALYMSQKVWGHNKLFIPSKSDDLQYQIHLIDLFKLCLTKETFTASNAEMELFSHLLWFCLESKIDYSIDGRNHSIREVFCQNSVHRGMGEKQRTVFSLI